jgi:hypothetical protein
LLKMLWAQPGLIQMVNQYYSMGTGKNLYALFQIFEYAEMKFNDLNSISLGVEDVDCKMSKLWTKGLTGVLETIYTGSMMCNGLRHWRLFYMEMLNLRLTTLPYRLDWHENVRTVSVG